jgi:hypothetical protein
MACFISVRFVPWVLVFDNMKTVTTSRDTYHPRPTGTRIGTRSGVAQ